MAACPERQGITLPDIPALGDVWAKSPVGDATRGETLVEHTAAVLQQLAGLYRLRPCLAAEIGQPRLWHDLYWAAFLHDWGKAATGFQAQLRPGGPRWQKRHEVLSLAFVDYVAAVGDPAQRGITAAIVSHHREADFLAAEYAEADEVEDDAVWPLLHEVPEATLRGLWEWLTRCGPTWVEELGFTEAGVSVPGFPASPEPAAEFRQRAFRRIHRLLRDFQRFVGELKNAPPDSPARRVAILLRGLSVTADHAGSAHTTPFPLRPEFSGDDLLRIWAVQWGQPLDWDGLHEHQRACAGTTASIALAAPTGSGKTESALLWAAAHRDNRRPRLFYVLPYQASMNAMRTRLAGLYGEELVGLQHGKARHALYRRLLEQDYLPRDAARAAKDAVNLSRLHHPPVRVLSPYQLLKACYRLKGYEAIWADLYGGLFIGDEIHAYEVKRLALIIGLFRHLSVHYDARFCLMSATFPRLLREWLAEAIPDLTMISATPDTFAAFRRHHLRLQSGELGEHLDLIRQTAASGLAILVCCNTVRRAQEVYAALRDRPPGDGWRMELLHGRFNPRDRTRKEQALLAQMGTRVSGGDRRALMVATQVVEVSLDIDFDVLFTEPAPLDALLQRFGRVNRGRRVPLRAVYVFDAPTDGQRVYDGELVERAVNLLRREFGETGGPLDEGQVSAWLDEIYAGEVAERWQAEYRRELAEFEAAILGTLYPFQADESLEAQFYQAFDSVEVLPACLEEEYRSLAETEPLVASELLVPIRYGQLARLKREGQVQPTAEWPPVVDVPYTSEEGLRLT